MTLLLLDRVDVRSTRIYGKIDCLYFSFILNICQESLFYEMYNYQLQLIHLKFRRCLIGSLQNA